MREIKFRAWDGAKMVYTGDKYYCDHFDAPLRGVTDKCVVTHLGIQFWLLETKLACATDKHFDHYKIIHAEVMQFTGLQDKNGVDIYEDDYVYIAGSGVMQMEFPFIELYEASPEGDIEDIRGNIHQNPELLER